MGHKAWEQWQIDLLRAEYGKTDMDVLAVKLGKNKQAIAQYAHNHGVSSGRYWSKEEEQYLIENYGRMTARTISKRLGKDYRATLNKINHMEIGNFLDNTEHLHLADVSKIVSRDKETIKKCWFTHGLNHRKVGRYTIIKEIDLIKFMKENPKYWNATECDYYFFSRFGWFQTKLKQDSLQKREKRWGNVS